MWLLHCRKKKKVETAPQLCRQDCGCCTAGKRRRWRPLHNSAGRTLAAALQEKEEGGCPLEYRKNSSFGFTRRGSVESRVVPRLASYDRLRVLVIHEWVTTVETRQKIRNSNKLRGGSHVEAGCFTSAQVVVPNSQQISCLDGSFLECSLPAREASVRSLVGTCQSRDL